MKFRSIQYIEPTPVQYITYWIGKLTKSHRRYTQVKYNIVEYCPE